MALVVVLYLALLGVGIFYAVMASQQKTFYDKHDSCASDSKVDKPLGFNPGIMLMFAIGLICTSTIMPLWAYHDHKVAHGSVNLPEFSKTAVLIGLILAFCMSAVLGLYYGVTHFARQQKMQVCPEVAKEYDVKGWHVTTLYLPFAIMAAFACAFAVLMFMAPVNFIT